MASSGGHIEAKAKKSTTLRSRPLISSSLFANSAWASSSLLGSTLTNLLASFINTALICPGGIFRVISDPLITKISLLPAAALASINDLFRSGLGMSALCG